MNQDTVFTIINTFLKQTYDQMDRNLLIILEDDEIDQATFEFVRILIHGVYDENVVVPIESYGDMLSVILHANSRMDVIARSAPYFKRLNGKRYDGVIDLSCRDYDPYEEEVIDYVKQNASYVAQVDTCQSS